MSPEQWEKRKCPWVELKENNQGVVYWCEKCGSINQEWTERKPSLFTPTKIVDKTCHDLFNRVVR